MRVLIAGVDGYIGWPLAQYLAARGHDVGGVDLLLRRQWVAEAGGDSAIPIASPSARLEAFAERFGRPLWFREGDLRDYALVAAVLEGFRPDAIVHLGEMASAPYSMIDAAHAVSTQTNNVVGTLNLLFAMRDLCPETALVKLGTMGEYGTPDVDIPEGFFDVEYRGRRTQLPFPRQAGSWYHLSKVHDSHNVAFACRVWNLRATDIMQGVVYGTRIEGGAGDPRLSTRLDFDQCFGTAVNRFCCQAVIEEPLTPFGAGGQRRGFLPLRDAVRCLTIALEHPPAAGEYRVWNQFATVHRVGELAERVQAVALSLGLAAEIAEVENPRVEAEAHHYNPDREHLVRLGYEPTTDVEGELRGVLEDLLPHRARILAHRDALVPDVRWDGTRKRVRVVRRSRGEAA